MQILFVAAEVAPLAKVGGMGDVVGALPKILKAMGHDVRIFMPYYGFLPKKIEIPHDPIWWGHAMFQDFSVFETTLPDSDVPLYLMAHWAFSSEHQIYGGEDEDWRFTLFSNGAAEFAWNYWKPQIIHCHDWHTAMVPVWMSQTSDIGTVFTIHNLAYQGPWRGRLEQLTWCPWYMEGDNAMAAAVQFADRVNTVSPTYAQQIQTAEYGEKMDGLLSFISGKSCGILNGIDTTLFDPAVDEALAKPFTADTLENRQANKAALQKEMGLAVAPDVFLMGMVTRLVEQKGLDLVIQTLDRFMAYTDAQFILLGTGDRYYETQLWEIAARYPNRMATYLLYSDPIGRRIYGGADTFLMPSRFEPCGISQMIAMRYGCVPIVRRTGGLVDTVEHHNPLTQTGTGYCFDRYEPLDLYTCLVRAWEGFKYKPQWEALQKRCMATNFSWKRSATEYLHLYRDILELPVELTVPAAQSTERSDKLENEADLASEAARSSAQTQAATEDKLSSLPSS